MSSKTGKKKSGCFRWVKRLGGFIFLLYLIGLGSLYFLQDDLIFHPDRLPENHSFRTGTEVELEVDKGIFINCLLMPESGAEGVILYLHGNRGSNRRCLRQAQSLAGNSLDIFMPDYRGYGKSDGAMYGEKQAFADMQIVYDYLLKDYREENITIVGYSLGSAMASHLAAENNPGKLVLVAPFYSILDLKNMRIPIVPSFLAKYPFRNYRALESVRCPVQIYHGTNDELIPFSSALRLQEINPDGIEVIPLKGEGHRGAIFDHALRRGFSQFVRK